MEASILFGPSLRRTAHHLLHHLPPLVERGVAVQYRTGGYLGERGKRVLDHHLVERRLVGHVEDAEPTATTGEELEGLHTVPVALPPVGETFQQAGKHVGGNEELRFDEYENAHVATPALACVHLRVE